MVDFGCGWVEVTVDCGWMQGIVVDWKGLIVGDSGAAIDCDPLHLTLITIKNGYWLCDCDLLQGIVVDYRC